MFLKHRPTGNMVEVLDTLGLSDPCKDEIAGRFHAGEELQDAAPFIKKDLLFPSGESLPRCWVDPHYRQ